MKDLFNNEEIRALSWKEPFASLMLHGKIETRTWDTKYRGLVLICASKKGYNIHEVDRIAGNDGRINGLRVSERIAGKIVNKLGQFWRDRTKDGKAIAIGRLIDSRAMEPEDEDKCFVAHRNGLYCHIYEYVRPVKPFPWKGSQGWKRLTQEDINKIEYL